MSLATFINEQNQFNSILGQPLIETPTNFEECKPHFKTLVSKMSPENLYCDGEASQEQVSNQQRFIAVVWNELETISSHDVDQDEAIYF